MTGHDVRLLPLAAAAWAGSYLGTRGDLVTVAMAMAVAIGVAAVAGVVVPNWRGWIVLGIACLIVTSLTSAWRTSAMGGALPGELAGAGAAVTVRYRPAAEPRSFDRIPRLVVSTGEMTAIQGGGRRAVTSRPIVVFATGDVADALEAMEPGGGYDIAGTAGIAEPGSASSLTIQVTSVSSQRAPPSPLDAFVTDLRLGLREATAWSRPEQAALLPSLVVGDTSRLTEDLADQFRVTSLSHLLAVSGANLTLLLGVLLALIKAVGLRGWSVRLVAVAGVAMFVLVCRGEPSVLRAAAMGLVTLAALGASNGRRSLRHLSVTVLGLLLIDPWLARSFGFALSVLACLGIALVAPTWTAAIQRWAPRWLAEALAVSLAAQLATQPLITLLSGQVSVIGVVANVLAGPFVGPATVLGLAATVLGWWPWAAHVAAWLGGWCLQPILWCAGIGSQLPQAAVALPANGWGVAISAVLAIAVALTATWATRRALTTTALIVALLAVSLIRPIHPGWPGQWLVTFCDVGQGDATVLRAADGVAVLIDAGPAARPTRACLDSLGISRVPVVVLTHFHADHIGGATEIIDTYQPDLIVISPLEEPASAAGEIRSAAQRAGADVVTAAAGYSFSAGQVRYVTLGAYHARTVAGGEGESSAENDSSVIGVADVAGLRVIVPGDAEPDGQRRALASAAQQHLPMSAQVLKFPHHGSSRQEERFFEASAASLAVVSCGADNDYGHPAASALDLASKLGMTVVRTDEQGSIAVGLDADGLTVRTG
ncbi:MAG: ComEC/Rec2 family competence protein [Arachnia sp.]